MCVLSVWAFRRHPRKCGCSALLRREPGHLSEPLGPLSFPFSSYHCPCYILSDVAVVLARQCFLLAFRFEQAGLSNTLLHNVAKAKYRKPTPVQKHAIPCGMAGRDVMGCAQTGSGKTVSGLDG